MGDALGRAGCGPRACAVREKVGPSGNGGTRVERPRREGAREQARLGRVLGREGELGPGKRFGLGFLGRSLGLSFGFPFLFLHLFPISISNSTSSQMNSNLNFEFTRALKQLNNAPA